MTYEHANIPLILANLVVLREHKRLNVSNDFRMEYRVDAYSRAIANIESMIVNHRRQFADFKKNSYKNKVAGSSIMKIIEHVVRTDSDHPQVSKLIQEDTKKSYKHMYDKIVNTYPHQYMSLKQQDHNNAYQGSKIHTLDKHNHPVLRSRWSFINFFKFWSSP
jgi:hypothetical protein